MDFSKLYNRTNLPIMNSRERVNSTVLVVESDYGTRNTLRQTLYSLEFGNVSDAADHLSALKKIEERPFTHVIFEAKRTTMPAKEFLHKAMERDNKLIMIPSSYEPTVDDVFDLLIVGARSFLVKPFTTEGVDEALVMATKGEPISDSILYAKDRNDALASLMLVSLDKLATLMRQAKQFETARVEIPRKELNFKRAVDIAKTFAQGGEDALIEALLHASIERGEGPATKLGRVRKMLRESRGEELPEIDPEII